MAGRGRGRGRGFGGGGFGGGGYAKQEPFVLFPTDVTLPNIKGVIDLEQKKTKGLTEEEKLVHQSIKFLRIWKGSPFYLEQAASKEKKNPEVERFSDRTKPKTNIKRGSLFDILELKGFPQELTGGSKGWQPSRKRARWNSNKGNSDRDSAIFDVLEKREANADGKEKKDSEGEDEDQEQEEEVSDEEYFSDNDYQQNQDFDDDDDDFNMEDDGADEPLL